MYKDPDRLSYFKIEGICEELGINEPSRVHYLARGNLEQDMRLIEDNTDVVSMCKLNEGGSRDTIVLYVESCHASLAVKVPEGVGGGIDGGVGAGVAIGGDVSVGVEEEFDWLNEGLEGKDFANDIFGEFSPPHTVPYKPNTVSTTNTPHPNTNTPQPNTNAPNPSNVPPPNIDLDEE